MGRPHRRAATACAGGLAVLLLGACGAGKPDTPVSTAPPTLDWGRATPTRPADDPGRVAPNKAGRKAAPDGTVWHLTLKPHEAPVDDTQWPAADDLFSATELAAIFPDGSAIGTTDCDRGTWPDGDETSHNTECKIEVTLRDDLTPSTIRVRIEGFGADFAMTQRFDEQRAVARRTAENFPDNYTFFRDGAFGAKKIYQDGLVVTALISDGTVAGQFTLQFSGFFSLADNDYDAAKKALYTQVMPLLIQTLAAKMPRTR